jgi:hypothetical protein
MEQSVSVQFLTFEEIMNTEIERLYSAIALEIFEARPDDAWTSGTYRISCISSFIEGKCVFRLIDKTEKSVKINYKADFLFLDLRKEMAKLNNNGHAWYAASCTLSDVGKFNFDFDYEHLPDFEIIPDPERWTLEFKEFPRPNLQLQVQDWIDGKVKPEIIVARLKELQNVR